MKHYLYIRSSGLCASTVTEEWVRAQVAKWPAYAPSGEQVLQLEVGQTVSFQSGAFYKRLADDAEPVTAMMCRGRGGAKKRCTHITYGRPCGLTAPYLCDYPKPGGGTCDAPRCASHRRSVGPDLDYCISHREEPPHVG